MSKTPGPKPPHPKPGTTDFRETTKLTDESAETPPPTPGKPFKETTGLDPDPHEG